MARSVSEAEQGLTKAAEDWSKKIDNAIDSDYAGMGSTVTVSFNSTMNNRTLVAIKRLYEPLGWTVVITNPTTDMRGESSSGSIRLTPNPIKP